MRLRYVTLTGADDDTNPSDMWRLSREYPFVEWAILFSQSRTGSRYPSDRWINDMLADRMSQAPQSNFAAHLCGKWVESVFSGSREFWAPNGTDVYRRIQLNLGRERLGVGLGKSEELAFLFQSLGVQGILGGNYGKWNKEGVFSDHLVPLFDASGGRGLGVREWKPPIGPFCGYAGGLGPVTIADELERIAAVVGDREIWVDMESNIRTDDKLDMKKCEIVLQAAKKWA